MDRLTIPHPGRTSIPKCRKRQRFLPIAEAAVTRIRGAGRNRHGAGLASLGGRGLGIRAGDCTGDGEGDDEAADDEFQGVAP